MKNNTKNRTQAAKAATAQTGKSLSYGAKFLGTHTMTQRGNKSIYIRQEYHERISRIVQIIGSDEIPLYAYLDNILQHHFEMFEQMIIQEYRSKSKLNF